MNNLLHANTLKEQGLYVVPLYRGLKFSGDTAFIDREYTDELLQKPLCDEQTGKQLWHADGNQGLNLEKSKLKDIVEEDVLMECLKSLTTFIKTMITKRMMSCLINM